MFQEERKVTIKKNKRNKRDRIIFGGESKGKQFIHFRFFNLCDKFSLLCVFFYGRWCFFTYLRLARASIYKEGNMDDICSVLDILVLFISKLLDMNRQQEKHDIHCNGFTKIDRDGVDEDVGGFPVFSQILSLSTSFLNPFEMTQHHLSRCYLKKGIEFVFAMSSGKVLRMI